MSEEKLYYDIAIIGAGPGGYTAAIRAAQLGKSSVLIEKDEIGGTCLNHGCIPTKTIHYSTRIYSQMKRSANLGISADNIAIDLSKIIDRKDRIVGQLRKGLQYLFKENCIDVIKGEGKLIDKHNIEAGGQKVHAADIILAMGSRVQEHPPFPVDEKTVFTSNGILNLRTVPKSIAIIGAGPIGIEMACIFNEIGSKVTVFEIMPRIMPLEDAEVTKVLEQSLIKRGIEVRTGTSTINQKEFDAVLISSGRTPNTHGLEDHGIKLDKGKVIVNEHMQTSVVNIFAIGDIAGRYMFAHTAAREGIVAVENICGHKSKMDYTAVPRCTYSEPGVGSVGLTEQEARARNIDIKIGKFPFTASSKALIEDDRAGFVKIIADKTDKIIGVHILGRHATEMIAEAALALHKQMKLEDLASTIHAHPTVYESIYEATENALKRSILILNK